MLALCVWGLLAALAWIFRPVPGLEGMPTAVDALLALAIVTVLTGGLHLDGLGDTFDALGSRAGRERALEIMRDSRIGSYGVLALGFVLGLKAVLLLALPGSLETMIWGLALALTAGRWGMTIGCALGTYARKEGLGAYFVADTGFRHVCAGAVVPVACALWHPRIVSDGTALAAVAGAAVMAWAWTGFCTRRFGGVTGDTLGATNELSELTVLFLLSRVG